MFVISSRIAKQRCLAPSPTSLTFFRGVLQDAEAKHLSQRKFRNIYFDFDKLESRLAAQPNHAKQSTLSQSSNRH